MKQDPRLKIVEKNMMPGEISNSGFLGNDERKLVDILLDDGQAVTALQMNHQILANRMEDLTEKGRQGFGNPILVDGFLEVIVEDSRGTIACPFQHKGMYPKENVRVTNRNTGESISWTALNIHMIREHGFYEGKGSPFRVEPLDLIRILEIKG
ncbi:MAG: hypothetical protein ACOYEH_08120 [Caldicoprobacterales bacterium]|jgi:hypothetical protein|nr:hypothetical protein [Clostridiales bacterium]